MCLTSRRKVRIMKKLKKISIIAAAALTLSLAVVPALAGSGSYNALFLPANGGHVPLCNGTKSFTTDKATHKTTAVSDNWGIDVWIDGTYGVATAKQTCYLNVEKTFQYELYIPAIGSPVTARASTRGTFAGAMTASGVVNFN